ncbi:MAG: TetR/AcrR family transcriptional regulator [Pseudomonadota bacterium]|nr:TetR/AcrR family transcriptional regulator [Pseudomonadota bacterium]
MNQSLSQAERTANTINKLNEAVIEKLVTLGYSGCTTQKIAAEAGLSTGAIFRHFETLQELIIDTADKLSTWMVDDYHNKIAPLKNKGVFELDTSMEALYDVMQSPMHYAWLELLIASRTNESLREAMQPIVRKNRDYALQRSREYLPDFFVNQPDFEHLLESLLMQIRGDMMHQFALSEQEIKEKGEFHMRYISMMTCSSKSVQPS